MISTFHFGCSSLALFCCKKFDVSDSNVFTERLMQPIMFKRNKGDMCAVSFYELKKKRPKPGTEAARLTRWMTVIWSLRKKREQSGSYQDVRLHGPVTAKRRSLLSGFFFFFPQQRRKGSRLISL